MLLRPGNAGANTVADHVRVLTDTLARPSSSAAKILIRVDGAGATHGLLEQLEALNTTQSAVRYAAWKITEDDERAIARPPEAAWETSVHQDGSIQEGYFVAEPTGMNTREGWPEGMRLMALPAVTCATFLCPHLAPLLDVASRCPTADPPGGLCTSLDWVRMSAVTGSCNAPTPARTAASCASVALMCARPRAARLRLSSNRASCVCAEALAPGPTGAAAGVSVC